MRGRCFVRTKTTARSWVTPAYAGTISFRYPCKRNRKVYPHIRGDDALILPPKFQQKESPPHTRGRYAFATLTPLISRFTPARTGTIARKDDFSTIRKVHPRMCGDDIEPFSEILLIEGSPPHVQGRWTTKKQKALSTRFTPACAGTIIYGIIFSRIYKGHPRVCGDDDSLPSAIQLNVGSPPHARGQSHIGFCNKITYRFTPAYAGTILEKKKNHGQFE